MYIARFLSRKSIPLAYLFAWLLTESNFLVAYAFQSPTTVRRNGSTTTPTKTQRSMVKFNGEKWVTEKPEETSANNYPLVNTLLRHGPKPFLTRLLQPNDYDQAILKFMASDKVDRQNAQGNMDAYLQNPNDWAFNRLEEQRRGVKYDYVTLESNQVILVVVWSTIVIGVVSRVVYSITNHVGFVRTYFGKLVYMTSS